MVRAYSMRQSEYNEDSIGIFGCFLRMLLLAKKLNDPSKARDS